MADVKYTVTVDSTGAVKQIELLDDAWKKVEKTTPATSGVMGQLGQALKSVAGQFTIATIAAKGIQDAVRGVKEFFSSAVEGAIKDEASQFRLRTALEMSKTARASGVRGLESFAQAQAKSTIYTDEEIRATMALLASITKLDNEGLKQTTKGIIGMAAVLGPEEGGLGGATMKVMRAIEGNAAGLKRVGIEIDTTLPKGEQLVQLQQRLAELYPRATAELQTMSGQVINMKKEWGELKEELGSFILKTTGAKEATGALAGFFRELRTAAMDTAEELTYARVRQEMWSAAATANLGGELPIEKVLKVLKQEAPEAKTSYEELMGAFLKGPAVFDAFVKGVIAASDAIAKAREDAEKGTQSTFDLGQAFQDLGVKADTELRSKLELAKKALEEYQKTSNPAAGVVAALAQKVDELTLALKGPADPLEAIRNRIKRLEPDLKDAKEAFEEFKQAALEGLTVDLPPIDEMFKMPEEAEVPPFIQATIDGLGELNQAGHLAQIEAGRLAGAWNVLDKTGLDSKLVALKTRLEEMVKSGTATERQMADVRREIRRTEDELRDTPKAVLKLQDAFTSMAPYVEAVFSGLNAVFSQAQQNREIAIENEYKKRLKYIEATVKDEDEKQKAIQTLEAEFEIKRTEARAASAKQAKAVALAQAVWSTARAVAEALPNFILAAVVAAMGAIQIATIAKQPIPLARGAVFRKPTVVSTSEGQTFEMGEAGVEYLVPEKHLAPMLGRSLTGFLPSHGYGGVGRGSVVNNFNAPLVKTSGVVSDADLAAAGNRLYRVIERQSRRRGRR